MIANGILSREQRVHLLRTQRLGAGASQFML